MKNEVVISDEYKRLKEEMVRLKAQLAALTEEKNDLEFVICPKLHAEYMEKIGDYVNRINAQELIAAELLYRIRAYQGAINRAESVDDEKVDEDVKQQYKEYQQRVDEQFEEAKKTKEEQARREQTRRENEEKYNRKEGERGPQSDPKLTIPAIEPKEDENSDKSSNHDTEEQEAQEAKRASDDDELKDLSVTQKIKELYRRIVKKLHPDVNPDITGHEKNLLNKANNAYRDGDLETLEDIYDEIMMSEEKDIPESIDGIEELKVLIAKIKEKIAELRREIEIIKTSFPYSEKDFLEDDKAVEKKQAEYKRIIDEYEVLIDELSKRLDMLKEELRKRENGQEED